MQSIVIPAHNEQRLLSSTLAYLLADKLLVNSELIIVCNGCIDKTPDVACQFERENKTLLDTQNIQLSIIETDVASKTNALNLGIDIAQYETTILLDADILVSGGDLVLLASELNNRKLLAVSPKIHFVYQQSPWIVKKYFDLVKYSNYNQKHRLSNVIALSANGIKKLGTLPEVIADDEYIRRQFKDAEYQIIDTLSFDFICPKSLSSLLQVLTRVERGNLQLAHHNFTDKSGVKNKGFGQKTWLSLAIFIFAKLFSTVRAKIQFKLGKVKQWERDESNRL